MSAPASPLQPQLSRDEAERFVEAATAALALPLPQPCRAGTVEALVRLSAAAALVLSFPLSERDEPAPVFRP